MAAPFRAEDGGADRIRTCDLLIANETLYQLSYDPIHENRQAIALAYSRTLRNSEVGLGRRFCRNRAGQPCRGFPSGSSGETFESGSLSADGREISGAL